MVHSHPCATKKGCLGEIWQVVLGMSKGCVRAGSRAACHWAALNVGCVKGTAHTCLGCDTPLSDGGCSEAREIHTDWFLHTLRCLHSWAQGCTFSCPIIAFFLPPQCFCKGGQKSYRLRTLLPCHYHLWPVSSKDLLRYICLYEISRVDLLPFIPAGVFPYLNYRWLCPQPE